MEASTSTSLYTGDNSIAKSTTWPEIETGASLLLAWQLKNRRVLIVGGGNVAADRLRSVLPTEAKVTIVCPEDGIGEEVKHRVVTEGGKFGIEWRNRGFDDADINEEHWDMVLTALDDPELSKHIYSLAKKQKMNINVADVPPLCDFYFGSVIRRGSLQVMISTNGKGPRLANRIRRQIEAGLPPNVGEAIEKIGELRKQLRKRAPGSEAETVKRRMEWMVRVTDSWTLDELADMTLDQQEAILSSWEEDYARTFVGSSSPLIKWTRRALCPYWALQLINPLFWLRKGQLDPATIETRRKACPVYKSKSSVEPQRLQSLASAGGGVVLGISAILLLQQGMRRFNR